MNVNGSHPVGEITCFRDVPDYHDPVEHSFGPELRAGQLLDGRFAIVEALSRSGMAVIYQARDREREDQIVAVKVPHLRLEADPGFFSRFQREEEIGRKLSHPYILKFFPVERKSRPYIVTEYLRGCTLAHLLDALRPLPEKDALKIASLVCEALQHMHGRRVVHRDLKPGNIMICRDRTIRLMDFGIASAADSKKITLGGITATLGTPEYMSPEQVKNERGDERSDIYCLGAVLYEMLTGVVPFQNDNCWVAMNDRVTGDPIAPRKLNPALSPQAEEIVLHALQRDPDDRYPTAAAMKVDLDAPDDVKITGYSHRLRAPHWRLSLRATPIVAGTLLAVAFITLQVVAFFVLRRFLGGR
jgi:serine/threonine-protein kinase